MIWFKPNISLLTERPVHILHCVKIDVTWHNRKANTDSDFKQYVTKIIDTESSQTAQLNNEWNLHRNDSSSPVEDQIVPDQLILAVTKDLLVQVCNNVNFILFRCFRQGFNRLWAKNQYIMCQPGNYLLQHWTTQELY